MTHVHQIGVLPDIDAIDGREDVWDHGGTADWADPATVSVLDISSASTNDDVGGTGATQLTIEGLDADGAVVSEAVALDGITTVNSTNAYSVVHRAYVSAAGSGATNDGAITLAASGGEVLGVVAAGNAATLSSVFRVPVQRRFTLERAGSSLIAAASGTVVTCGLWAKPDASDVWELWDQWGLFHGGGTTVQRSYRGFVFPELTTLKITASTDTDNAGIAAHIQGSY